MKVLIYSHTFAPNVGGAETYVMLLARGLCDGSRTEKMCVQYCFGETGFLISVK